MPAQPVAAPDWRAAIRAAAYAFVLSRLIVLLSAAAAVAYTHQWTLPEPAEASLRLFTDQDMAHLEARVLTNDAGWYQGIVRDGYEERAFDTSRQANWAFFPLHPLLWRAMDATGLSPAVSGLLMANLLFFFGLFQAHRWMQMQWDRELADRAVLCLALFPTAYFFSLPWTESLFLALLSSALLAMAQGRWGWVAGLSMLASGTRAVGVLLVPLTWWAIRQAPDTRFWQRWLLPALGGIGLLAFMSLLWVKTGNPLAFSDIQITWDRKPGSYTKHLLRWIADPLQVANNWNHHWINSLSLLMALAGSVWLWRKGQRALALFVFIYMLLPWSTGTLMSMGRYAVACLPVFAALASWVRRPPVLLAWLICSACLLAWMSGHFAVGATFAGA